MNAVPQAWLDGVPCAESWMLDRGLHYGDGLFETMICRDAGIRFKALHAARLGFAHPRTGQALEFTTPPPPDMAALLAAMDAPVG